MDTKSLSELTEDPRNPRYMDDLTGGALQNSLAMFGDLSPVVFNMRTKQLVGGHRRVDTFKKLPGERRVIIGERAPDGSYLDDVGTVATGYIWIGNKQFAYREVDWDEGKQHSANIAANNIHGEFDQQLLAEITYELSQLENGDELLQATGFSEDEYSALLGAVSPLGDDSKNEPSAKTITCPNCGHTF